jgi:hypothetical protein
LHLVERSAGEAIGFFGSQGELVMHFRSKPLGAALGIAAIAAVIMATPGRAQQGPGAGQPPARHFGSRTGSSAIVLAKVNLRSGSGTDSEILASIAAGSTVDVGQCEGEWCAVTWNGQSGYAIARNLDLGGSRQASSSPPPAQPGGSPEGHDYPPGAYPPPAQSGGYAEAHDHQPGTYPPPSAQPGGYADGRDYPPDAYSPRTRRGGYADAHDYPPSAYPPAQSGGYADAHDHQPGTYPPSAQPGGYAEGRDYPPDAYSPRARRGGYGEAHDYPPSAYPPPAQLVGNPEGHDYPHGAYGPGYYAFYGRPVVYGRAYYHSPGWRWHRHGW